MRTVLTSVVIVLVIVALVLIVGAYTFVPALLAGQVSPLIRDQMNLSRDPEVVLRSSPAPNVYRGSFSGGDVRITGESFGDFRVRRVDVELDAFDVDVLRSITERRAVLESEDLNGNIRASISGVEVGRAAAASGTSGVSLDGDQLVVEQSRELFPGLEFPVEVRGGVSLEGSNLVFAPSTISAAGFSLPDGVTRDLVGDGEISFPLDGIPPRMALTDARIEGGNLILEGRLEGMFG